MSDNHTFPVVATVKEAREHLQWVESQGGENYRLEIRERYIAVIPKDENAIDHDNKVAFLTGVH